jgi:uncharacterized membrane protein
MKQPLFKNFCRCGIAGWCLEIIFTGITRHEKSLKCETSLLMFPIYGLASLIAPLGRLLKNRSVMFRGSCYTCVIFLTEYVTGKFLRLFGRCPWDYSNAPLNIDGVIRLDYAPLWFGTGLLYEKLLKRGDNE